MGEWGGGGGWQLFPTEFGKLCVPLKKSWLRPWQHRKQFRSTEQRTFKNTNIAHRGVWDHRNTAMWDFIHQNTAQKTEQKSNTANPNVHRYDVNIFEKMVQASL